MNRRNLYTIIALATILVASAGNAAAQTSNDLTRLMQEIERNEELLEQATELVAQTSSTKARTSLQAARRYHEQSLKLVAQGAGDGRLIQAAEYAARAREALLQTISIARRETKITERALKAIERATVRLEQAKLLAAAKPDAAAPRKLIEDAQGQLQRSQHNMREHLYEVALRLAISSNDLSERAIALLKGNVTDRDALTRELEKTDRALERVADMMSPSVPPQAQRLFQDAQDLQRKAKAQQIGGHPRAALDLTQRARDMAIRAMRLLATSDDRDNVERALHLTDMLLNEASEIAREQNVERLNQRIRQAQQLQDTARDHFNSGRFDHALKTTLRARDMLKDALAGVKKALKKQDVQTALEETDAMLLRVREQVMASDSDTAKDILERATMQQERAWKELRDDALRPALTHTRLARNLAQRAVEHASSS